MSGQGYVFDQNEVGLLPSNHLLKSTRDCRLGELFQTLALRQMGRPCRLQILPGLAIENVPAIPEVIQNWDRHEVKMQTRIVGADLPAFPHSCSRQVKEGNLISMPSHCQEERVDAPMRTVSKFPEWNVSRHEYFFRRRFHRFVSPSTSSSTCEVEEPCSCRTFFCRVFA